MFVANLGSELATAFTVESLSAFHLLSAPLTKCSEIVAIACFKFQTKCTLVNFMER